jgi:hypothetical protein
VCVCFESSGPRSQVWSFVRRGRVRRGRRCTVFTSVSGEAFGAGANAHRGGTAYGQTWQVGSEPLRTKAVAHSKHLSVSFQHSAAPARPAPSPRKTSTSARDPCRRMTMSVRRHQRRHRHATAPATATLVSVSMPRSVRRRGEPVTLPLRDRGRGITTRAQKHVPDRVHCLTRMVRSR